MPTNRELSSPSNDPPICDGALPAESRPPNSPLGIWGPKLLALMP